MTDLQVLYLVLVCCYLLECCVLVEGSPVIFMRLPFHWRALHQPGIAFFSSGRLIFLHPLPFAATWFSLQAPTATVTEKGIVTVNSWRKYKETPPRIALLGAESPEAKPYAASLRASGYPEWKGDAPVFSKSALARWTDPAPWAERVRAVKSASGRLSFFCTAQFCLLFFGAPVLAGLYPAEAVLLPFALAVLWFNACIAVNFAVFHRILYPAKGWGFLAKAVWMLIYPLSAIRAAATLCAPFAACCHESAVAHSLMNPKQRAAYLGDSLNRIGCQNFSRSLDDAGVAALAQANAGLRAALEKHWDAPVLTALPEFSANVPHAEPGALCFCPLCGISLTEATEFCPHCFEVRTLTA